MKQYMRKMSNFIKRLLSRYETGCEYWVNTKDIIAPSYLKKIPTCSTKLQQKIDYWNTTGEFESPIILNKREFDGYTYAKVMSPA